MLAVIAGAFLLELSLASVHKPLRVRDLWKELGFTRSSTHTVWPSEVSAS